MALVLNPPGYNGTPVSTAPSAPVAALAAASDTGIVGDNITGSKYVTVNLSGLSSGNIAWLERSGDTTFNSGTDLLAVNGVVNNVTLNTGANLLTFYQQSGTKVSTAGYLAVYLDPVSATAQTEANEDTLAKAALAYLGRPLTSTEHTSLLSVLNNSGSNPLSVANVLGNNPEFWAVYRVADLNSGVNRCYQLLYGRDATGLEQYVAKNWLDEGVGVLELPWRIVQSTLATSTDRAVLDARVMFSRQATTDYQSNLTKAGVSERTLLEVERSTVQTIKAMNDIGVAYEALVASAANIGSSSGTDGTPSAPVAVMDPAYDDGTVGDSMTTLSSVKINVTGVMTGGLAWLDSNLNGAFDPGADYPVINGSVTASLNAGPNTFVFYQMLNGKVSTPAYLALLRSDTSVPTTQPNAPKLDLRASDDDGTSNTDNITSKSMVQIDVSGLDAKSELAWIDKDGNGIFNLGTDISIDVGATTAVAWVPLTEGINGLSVYQVRGGLKSVAGNMTVILLKNTDVAVSDGISVVGSTMSLTFDRPVDWQRLDVNGDGKLTVGRPTVALPTADGIELEIDWGSIAGTSSVRHPYNTSVALTNFTGATPTAGTWNVDVPTYGSRFVTINDIAISFDGDKTTDDKLSVLVVGVPDVSDGITSNVVFNIAFA